MAVRDDGLGQTLFPGILTGVIAGLSVWALTSRLSSAASVTSFPRDDFFVPDDVAHIAAQFDAEYDDDFIQQAWDWVGGGIAYEEIGSELYFFNGSVECLDCYLAPQVLSRQKGNCVAKSSLLASILLNRLAPEDVRIVIGEVEDLNGVMFGHAWVEVRRATGWYLLESTVPPDPMFPWIPVADVCNYFGDIYMSLTDFSCQDQEMCAVISATCPCKNPVLASKY